MRWKAWKPVYPSFTAREDFERGFDIVFRRVIVPELDELEQERRSIYAKSRLSAWGGLTAGLAIFAVCFLPFLGEKLNTVILTFIFGFLFAIIVIALGYWLSHWLGNPFRKRLKPLFVEAACAFFPDLSYQASAEGAYDLERLRRIKPSRWFEVPATQGMVTSAFEDLFQGRHRDTDFKIFEAPLEQKVGASLSSLCLEMPAPVPVSGSVVIERSASRFALIRTPSVRENTVPGDPIGTFNEHFRIQCEDPTDEARLLTASFCTALLEIAALNESLVHDDWRTRLLFTIADGTLLILFPVTTDHSLGYYEFGSVKRSVYDMEDDIHAFLHQVIIPYRIIECFYQTGIIQSSDEASDRLSIATLRHE